jgi:ribosomal-protein-alanine N-acetyltransferase
MLSNITIRPMHPTDISVVIQIAQICQLTFWSEKSYEQELLIANSHSLVAIANGDVVGFVVARLLFETLEIFNIAVLPAFRRQKIGEKLLHAVLQIGQSCGAQECWLEVREKNIAAQNFYLSNNFEIAGRRVNYYLNPTETAILMTLKISDYSPKL